MYLIKRYSLADNTSIFIRLYNAIDYLLREKTGLLDPQIGFLSIVNDSNKLHIINNKQYEILKIVGRLRNAIIHDHRFDFSKESIANPHDEIIIILEKILASLEQPLTIQCLKGSPPRIFDQDNCLYDCISLMRDNNFSQVVVNFNGIYGLFTREDEARWLEQQATADEIIISLKDYKLKDLQFIDVKDQCLFISKTASVLELLVKFQDSSMPNLAAILVTEHGRATEKPIQIFTQWDLPDIIEKIELY